MEQRLPAHRSVLWHAGRVVLILGGLEPLLKVHHV